MTIIEKEEKNLKFDFNIDSLNYFWMFINAGKKNVASFYDKIRISKEKLREVLKKSYKLKEADTNNNRAFFICILCLQNHKFRSRLSI